MNCADSSALSRTTGHICLYTVGDVLEYYRTPKPVLRDPEQLGCEKLIDQACEIVARKTFGDRTMIMNEHWDSKFRHLQNCAGSWKAPRSANPPEDTREET